MFWQLIYCVFVAGYAIFIFGELIAAIEYGKRLRAALYVWCASPIPLLFVAVVVEQRAPSDLNINDLPWSLVFGDSFIVAPAAAVAADAWRNYPPAVEVSSSRRVWSLFTGLVVGTTFHVWDVTANYSPADMLVEWSPAKLLHDFGTFVALIATVVCMVLPLLRVSRWKTWHNWMILTCFAGLVGLMAVDGGRKLSARVMHMPWDPSSSWNELFCAAWSLLVP